jgi:hypothetical protein
MALTKIGSGGIENVTNAANATFLTIDASEQITVASEGGAVTTSLQQGLAKAWAKTNAAGTTIDDSNNVTSLTDNGAGDQTITLTNAMSNALYAVSIDNHSEVSSRLFLRTDTTATTTTVFRVGSYSSSYTDVQVGSAVIGDLA